MQQRASRRKRAMESIEFCHMRPVGPIAVVGFLVLAPAAVACSSPSARPHRRLAPAPAAPAAARSLSAPRLPLSLFILTVDQIARGDHLDDSGRRNEKLYATLDKLDSLNACCRTIYCTSLHCKADTNKWDIRHAVVISSSASFFVMSSLAACCWSCSSVIVFAAVVATFLTIHRSNLSCAILLTTTGIAFLTCLGGTNHGNQKLRELL